MKRILFFLLCSLMSMQIFSQNEISKELFPTLVGWERTNFIFYYNDGCSNETKSIHIASPTEIDFIDGKPYLYWGDFFLREENNKVFIYSFAYEKDFVLYDWSLEVGDTLPLLALDPYSYPDIEYPVVVDYTFDDNEYVEDENGNRIRKKRPVGSVIVKEVLTVTLLDGKEYKKWSFDSDQIGGFEYIEHIGCLEGYTFMNNCYFNLIQPEAIPLCYQGEHLVCASKNGELLYQMREEEMESFGIECKCLNNRTLNENYSPIVENGYKWNVVNRNVSLDADNTIVYSTHVEMFDGDSVVDGVTYKKLWSCDPKNLESRTLEGLIREDVSAQKVWAYGNGIEALIYDFDVEVGDTLSLLGWLHLMKNITAEELEDDETIVDVVVDNVETVSIGDFDIKKITLFDPRNKERKFDIYERFGSLRGWLRSDFGMVDGGGVNFMVCAFDNNGELLFKPTHNNELDEIENCYINETKTNIENITTSNTSLQKVIYNGQLLIIKDGKTYNLMGVEVQSALEK